ncbi:unnamed protein product [Spirodela intermedia]|uniref:Uncharacterized protein n=1 Tax=Spirodela intermedia TaxID=51605 RepID=A0A7I8JAE7_SPIIN|nr:unnamed protein product [Spirodela intermedia]CAA6667196.1 unnamed protein product [Spirodela intermedia]
MFLTSSLSSRRTQTVRKMPTICLLATRQYRAAPVAAPSPPPPPP